MKLKNVKGIVLVPRMPENIGMKLNRNNEIEKCEGIVLPVGLARRGVSTVP